MSTIEDDSLTKRATSSAQARRGKLAVLKYAKRRRQYPRGLDRYDEPKMGNEYDQKVNGNIAKYGVKDLAQSEGLTTELDDVNNDCGNRDGVYQTIVSLGFSR